MPLNTENGYAAFAGMSGAETWFSSPENPLSNCD